MTSTPDRQGVDLDLVMAEIHAEADRLRRTSPHGAELEAELDAAFARHVPPDLDAAGSAEAFAQLDALTAVSIPVPDSAPRPGRPEWKRTLLRAVGVVLRSPPVTRIVRMATSEVTAFNAASVRVLRRLDDRVARLESRVGEPSAAVRLAIDLVDPEPTPDAAVAALVTAIGRPPGRVLHVGCGRGELVRALTRDDVGSYGIDARRGLHVDALREGLDLRPDEPLAHVSSLEGRAVGAVVLDAVVDGLGVDEQLALLDAAVRAVAPGGRIVVHPGPRHGPGAIAADLSGGHPLLPATWRHLLSLRLVDVDEIDVEGSLVLSGTVPG